ncbi:MAG: DUF4435 domain-containing protein [Rudaea sp.]
MSLRRTPSGLASLSIFFAVDVVVFCEGGDSLNFAQATALAPGEVSLDVIFWQRVVSLYKDTRKFHFKSVGSKTTLTSIAADVESHNISNITVCMDSDYDRILKHQVSYRRVAYTYGYSWENDVFDAGASLEILRVLIGSPPTKAEVELKEAIDAFENGLGPWCETDIALANKGKKGVFDKSKPLACVDVSRVPLTFREAVLRKRLTDAGYLRRPRRVVSVPAHSACSVACGKLVARFYYHTIVGIAKRVDPKVNIDFSNFMRIAIAQTFQAIIAGQLPILANHYAQSANAF